MCDCPLCTAGSDGPICAPCWDLITLQRTWSDAWWAVTTAMRALQTIDGTESVAEALDRLEAWRCDFGDRVLGELGPAEEPR